MHQPAQKAVYLASGGPCLLEIQFKQLSLEFKFKMVYISCVYINIFFFLYVCVFYVHIFAHNHPPQKKKKTYYIYILYNIYNTCLYYISIYVNIKVVEVSKIHPTWMSQEVREKVRISGL